MAKALAVLWRLPIHAGSDGLNSGPLKRGEMKTSIFSKGHYLFRHTEWLALAWKINLFKYVEGIPSNGDCLCRVVHVESCVCPTIKTRKPWGHRLGLLCRCNNTEEQPQGFLEVNGRHLPFKGLGVPQSVRTVFSCNQTWNGKQKQQD